MLPAFLNPSLLSGLLYEDFHSRADDLFPNMPRCVNDSLLCCDFCTYTHTVQHGATTEAHTPVRQRSGAGTWPHKCATRQGGAHAPPPPVVLPRASRAECH